MILLSARTHKIPGNNHLQINKSNGFESVFYDNQFLWLLFNLLRFSFRKRAEKYIQSTRVTHTHTPLLTGRAAAAIVGPIFTRDCFVMIAL